MKRKHKAAVFGSAVLLLLGYGFYRSGQPPYRFTDPHKPFMVRGRPLSSGGGSVWAFTYEGDLNEVMKRAVAETGGRMEGRSDLPILVDGSTTIHFCRGRAALNPNPPPIDPNVRGPYDFVLDPHEKGYVSVFIDRPLLGGFSRGFFQN